ncbi:1-phosphofructokinase family hexose kinase [Paenibacillus sp. N3/727]|uniref:1-phosphofructokinase family hexose kinase n=1 Tax=Paenibacillus sp. N3/727 TaxID=2925845 RepID=UPI001F53D866|nr:1-phosphofructokinase family hexose kinase [Paenibacillus sp. N3/727]UNK20163.1 1-phosphofructokinase family hexose kinase [Paenibacillus sp. N3/727]
MNQGIVTVTLNAAIDKTYYMNGWSSGTVMRVDRVHAIAGGKGLNVSRVLHQLGHPELTATGFTAGYNGQFIVRAAESEGFGTDFVSIEGESRVCLSIVDEVNHTFTEALEPGPLVTPEDEERMKSKIGDLAQKAGLIIISGSLPKGCRPELYTELIEICSSHGSEVFLDTSGAALIEGMKGKPGFIKPNEDEIKPWLHDTIVADRNMDSESDAEVSLHNYGAAIQKLAKDTRISRVIVTLGALGALACIGDTVYRVHIPRMNIVNPVGSGDSFVAGYAFAHVRNMSAMECLRYAAAAGSANALNPTAGCVVPTDFGRLLEQIKVEPWG